MRLRNELLVGIVRAKNLKGGLESLQGSARDVLPMLELGFREEVSCSARLLGRVVLLGRSVLLQLGIMETKL